MGVRSRTKWCRQQLVGITGRLAEADGKEEVLVEGQEVWEEWTGQPVDDTDWRRGAKDTWEAMEKVVLRREWLRSVDRDKDYDRG